MGSVVQIYSGPPAFFGELAQLGERLVCNQEVTGSIPVFSTSLRWRSLRSQLRLASQRAEMRRLSSGSRERSERLAQVDKKFGLMALSSVLVFDN